MVYRQVGAPEGLRRLTSTATLPARRRRLFGGTGQAGSEVMAQSGAMDLEAGGSSRRGNGGRDSAAWLPWMRMVPSCAGNPLCFPRTWRWQQRAVVAVQAVLILALITQLRSHGSCASLSDASAAAAAAPAHVGPRVEFLADQTPAELCHLIMVPGHGVTIVESLEGVDSRDADWFLLDYQKNKDVPNALVGHIRGGLEVLDADESSLLLFSGGKTRVLAGPKSEGESYFFVADHYDWWGKPDMRARASTEDFARDSFENLLFSICRFKEITSRYPTKITVVGYDFKAERFETLHRDALRFPPGEFHYVGLHPEGRFDHAAAEEGERTSALEPYRVDPYGCLPGGPLEAKRLGRDPFHRTPPYSLVCPEMRELLSWCGPGLFEEPLPWSPTGRRGQSSIDQKPGS